MEPDDAKLEHIVQEAERLFESGEWNLDHFRRLYGEALSACNGHRYQLEMFSSYMLDESYYREADRISRARRVA